MRDYWKTKGIFFPGPYLATNTNAVKKEGECVANDPSLETGSPASSEHAKTEKHDNDILNQTPATADTVHSISLILLSERFRELTRHQVHQRAIDQR